MKEYRLDNLTPKQEKFCQEVVNGKSYSDAYRMAYNCEKMKDATINNKAHQLTQKGEIRARLEQLKAPKQKEVIENYGISLEWYVNENLEALKNEKAKKINLINNKVIHDISTGIIKVLGLDKSKHNVDITTEGKSINIVQLGKGINPE